jgi:hypothetical protein
MPKLNLPYEFISTQLAFAGRMSELSDTRLEDTLIDCTNIRTLLNIEVTHETAAESDSWQIFLRGLRKAQKPETWAYNHYLDREKGEPEIDATDGYGCFYYSYPFRDQPKVRLHFRNVDPSTWGALSPERFPARRNELTVLLREIRKKHPDAETVCGGSWLYNIEPYCRLFPPEYIASMKPVGYELQFWALWGQFLRGGFRPNFEAITRFCDAIGEAKSPEGCKRCFPYEVMRPECDIGHFYRDFRTEE